MSTHKPQRIIIVGNGYLPYLIALCIQKNFEPDAPELIIVDLGKPHHVEFIQSLGSMKIFHSDLNLPEVDFVKHTKAEINLGFDYSGFSKTTNSEIFSDAPYGFNLQNRRFSHLFSKFLKVQPEEKLENYCLCAKLAREGRFTPPSPKATSVYASINYGYRLSGEAYAEFLKSQLSPTNTRILLSRIEAVKIDPRGFIEAIDVQDTGIIQGDFYIDASESRILKSTISGGNAVRPLFPQNLQLEISHSTSTAEKKLPVSKISAPQEGTLQLTGSYLDQNYQTSIVLKEKTTSDTAAAQYFMDATPWTKNCLAMGHAATNRITVLIDNSHINQNMVLRLISLWPRTATMDQEAQAFNANTLIELRHIIDLDLLHLARALNRPEILSAEMHYKLETFTQSGKVAYYEKELLQEQQWPVLFNALGVTPGVIDLSVRNCADQWLAEELLRIKYTFAKAASAAPLYHDFIHSIHG